MNEIDNTRVISKVNNPFSKEIRKNSKGGWEGNRITRKGGPGFIEQGQVVCGRPLL
jgi:hypothetical protein